LKWIFAATGFLSLPFFRFDFVSPLLEFLPTMFTVLKEIVSRPTLNSDVRPTVHLRRG
jgi:hypothetical protein